MRIKFIEKTLSETADFFKWGFFAEKYTGRNGFLQKINAETKLISLILLSIIVNITHNITLLVIYYLLILVLAVVSKVEIQFFIKKILLIIPLMLAIILLPSIFNFVVKGHPLLYITKNIFITKEGLYLASIIILRTLISVSFVILINLTTPWNKILSSLKVFKIPEIIIQILNMSYRYLYILIKIVEDIHYALKSRIITKPEIRKLYKLLGFQIAGLFRRSANLTDLTYKAMVSRGYTAKY